MGNFPNNSVYNTYLSMANGYGKLAIFIENCELFTFHNQSK